GAGVRAELRILDVKHADAFVIAVDEAEIIQLLQQQVARVVENLRARMLIDRIEEALEGGAIVQVLAGVDLEAQVDPGFIERIEDRPPAPRQFGEALLDQTARSLWPGIHVRP